MNGDHQESFKKDGCDLQVQELLLTSRLKRSVLYSSPAAIFAVGALYFLWHLRHMGPGFSSAERVLSVEACVL